MNPEYDPLFDPAEPAGDTLFDDDVRPATAGPRPLPVPLPRFRISGVYRSPPSAIPRRPLRRHELRLDVDGLYPQMAASGVLRSAGGSSSVHWVATLRASGTRRWTGTIALRDGDAALLPQTQVAISVTRVGILGARARVTFRGGARDRVENFDRVAAAFDTVDFEFDATPDANPALSIDTHGHPQRPSGLPAETLSIATVFRRAGFDVTETPPGPPVPVAASVDGLWSDTEMHDAMQAHWQHWGNAPQWALWVFHAALSDQGRSLGGIMFDDIGPNHRQGTAIFTESFIKDAPAGDANPAAWVRRMRFWTAVHEMGHGFNLAHAWQKELGTPWMPLADDEESRSFMNYPFRVMGGQTAFFGDFEFRFSDPELLFMRHAPRRFVQMGNAAWFDHHGFEEAQTTPEPPLALALRVNKAQPVLQFMEPAMIELKATNISGRPMVVDDELLEGGHGLTLVVKREGQPARLWQPFATECREPQPQVLAAGASLYQPVFVGAGKGGWLIAEPGRYTVQASIRLDSGEDIVSPPLQLRVLPPTGFDEAHLAQDLFETDVARVIAFDGTRQMVGCNARLLEIAEQLPQRNVAAHVKVALGLPLRRTGKLLVDDGEGPAVKAVAPEPDTARRLLAEALVDDSAGSAATLGHIEYREYTEAYAAWLADEGERTQARKTVDHACETLAQRGVKAAVVASLKRFGQELTEAPDSAAAKGRKRSTK